MTTTDPLRRGYDRLLRAYPRRYRRYRGAELLTTLLDAAPPDRRRPSVRDAADLLLGALRCRLRPPRGAGNRLAATIAALLAAVVAAAVAGLLSSYPGPPTEAQAIAAFTEATGIRPANVPNPPVRCAGMCLDEEESPAADAVVAYDAPLDRTDRVAVVVAPPAAPEELVRRAHARLAAAGWRVDPVRLQRDDWSTANCPDCTVPSVIHSLDAVRGPLAISITGRVDRDTGADPSFSATVAKTLPAGAVVAVLAAAVAGLLTGWLVAVWVLWRRRSHGALLGAGLAVAGLVVLTVGVVVVAETGLLLTALTLDGDRTAKNLMIPGFVLSAFPPLTIALGAAAGLTLLLAALPAGRRPGRTRSAGATAAAG